MASFDNDMTVQQRTWLNSTRLPLREVVFPPGDGASSALLQTVRCGFAKPARQAINNVSCTAVPLPGHERSGQPHSKAALTM